MTLTLLARSLFLNSQSAKRKIQQNVPLAIGKHRLQKQLCYSSSRERHDIASYTSSESVKSTKNLSLASSSQNLETNFGNHGSYHDDDCHRTFECTLNHVLEMQKLGKDDAFDTGLDEMHSAIHSKMATSQDDFLK